MPKRSGSIIWPAFSSRCTDEQSSQSLGRPSAVDEKILTRDVGCGIAGKKNGRPDDIIGRAPAVQDCMPPSLFVAIWVDEACIGHLGMNVAGCQIIHSYIFVRKVDRKRF